QHHPRRTGRQWQHERLHARFTGSELEHARRSRDRVGFRILRGSRGRLQQLVRSREGHGQSPSLRRERLRRRRLPCQGYGRGLAFQDNATNGSLDLWIDDLALFKGGSNPGDGTGGAGGTSSGTGGATSCSSLPGSANPGSGSFTWYYFGQGTTQENGKFKTAC